MKDLIKALQIFLKYTDTKYPTACSHDVLYVMCDPNDVSNEDIKELDKLGFFINDVDGFSSYKYGSC